MKAIYQTVEATFCGMKILGEYLFQLSIQKTCLECICKMFQRTKFFVKEANFNEGKIYIYIFYNNYTTNVCLNQHEQLTNMFFCNRNVKNIIELDYLLFSLMKENANSFNFEI